MKMTLILTDKSKEIPFISMIDIEVNNETYFEFIRIGTGFLHNYLVFLPERYTHIALMCECYIIEKPIIRSRLDGLHKDQIKEFFKDMRTLLDMYC